MKALFITILLIFIISGCKESIEEYIPPTKTQFTYESNDVALKWGEMTVKIYNIEPGNTPTYASRCLGYLGLAMYESIVHGFPKYRSLAGQLNDLKKLPVPESGKEYNWNLSLNAAQAAIIRDFYPNINAAKRKSLDSLETAIYQTYNKGGMDISTRSVEYGKQVAQAILDWSYKDGGREAYSVIFDEFYKLPTDKGKWIPVTVGGQSPLGLPMHPRWGKNRTFVKANSKLKIPQPIKYSESPDSEYYKQYNEVYEVSQKITTAQKEIVVWWGDDPSQSMTPPGHSYNLANITIRKAKPNLIDATQTYARVGMAVADAFISCWKIKYDCHVERPSSYIRGVLKKESWFSFFPEPAFPAFTSGHATQSAAMATVLTSMYGANFSFTDDTHKGRKADFTPPVEYKPRNYKSFLESAEECAMSRLYGQIHTRQDNNVGLQEGKKVGANVNALAWKK